jgi:hypothetical protein
VVVLVGGMLALQVLLQSVFAIGTKLAPVQEGPPQKLFSERAALSTGASLRYDFVLSAEAGVRVEVRAEPVPVVVKLVPTPEPVKPPLARRSGKTRTTPVDDPSTPVLWQQAGLTVIHVEELKAGKWTLVLELSDRSGVRDRSATTFTLDLSVR